MKDYAPRIYRQRCIIEGLLTKPSNSEDIKKYLSSLSKELGMKALTKPITNRSTKYGWAGWIHWESSGCHIYAWEQPRLFFSVDIYTCKKFHVRDAVTFTKNFFKARKITHKSV